jgi:hypothetical protein
MNMPRTRFVKPEFFAHEVLGEAGPLGSLLFIGLLTIADREGRLEDRPLRIRAQLFPYWSDADPEPALRLFAANDLILRYSIGDKGYIQIANFVRHQGVRRNERPSRIPPPPGHADQVRATNVGRKQRERVLARDGHRCRKCGRTTLIAKGDSSDGNLQTLCAWCNGAKGGNHPGGRLGGRPRGSNPSYLPPAPNPIRPASQD